MISEQPDDKKIFIMQKEKIAIAVRDCLNLWLALW
jgi:hypothetical protein